MIKRRFYKQDHGDGDDASDSSSSSDSDADSMKEEFEEDEEEVTLTKVEEEKPKSPSSGSGYESEDSSGNEVNCDSSGLVNGDEDGDGSDTAECLEGSLAKHKFKTTEETPADATKASNAKDSDQLPLDDCVLKCKSVFKCRLCPRIVCLSEETLKAHLSSKRHARSKKLLTEGRLKFMLNSDGEIEEDQETHAERHSRTMALTHVDSANPKKKNKGRQRQKLRSKKKKLRESAKSAEKIPSKKRRKTEE